MKRISLLGLPILVILLASLGPSACWPVEPSSPDGGDGGSDEDDGSVSSGLEILNTGPHLIEVGQLFRVQLTGDGGTPPYAWSLPQPVNTQLSWVGLEEQTGLLQGRPTDATEGEQTLVVVMLDHAGASVQGAVQIQVAACSDGDRAPCDDGEVGGVCYEGYQVCANGVFEGPCHRPEEGQTPSDEFDLCGASCGGCSPGVASLCVDGVCQCGDEPACGGGEACCATDGGRSCSDLQSDVENCSACGERCVKYNNGTVACVEGSCQFGCADGWDRCTAENPTEPGACETDLKTNSDHCGSCGLQCYAGLDAGNLVFSGECDAGVCEAACRPGYANCSGGLDCECPPPLVGDDTGIAACTSGGSCDVNCGADGHDCGGACFKLDSRTHCRACGEACPANPANTVTNSTVCAPTGCQGTCLPGWSNCDQDWANGCEVHTASDVSNCGGCTDAGADFTCNSTWSYCKEGQCSEKCSERLNPLYCAEPSRCSQTPDCPVPPPPGGCDICE